MSQHVMNLIDIPRKITTFSYKNSEKPRQLSITDNPQHSPPVRRRQTPFSPTYSFVSTVSAANSDGKVPVSWLLNRNLQTAGGRRTQVSECTGLQVQLYTTQDTTAHDVTSPKYTASDAPLQSRGAKRSRALCPISIGAQAWKKNPIGSGNKHIIHAHHDIL